MNLQIRIRTDVAYEDLAYISDWLGEAKSGYAFEHNVPGNHHYHVYLFGLERNPDAMRRYLGKHLPTKECYAVSTTCGKSKSKVEPTGAYIYGTTHLLLDPIWEKGFTEEEMIKFRLAAVKFYGKGVHASAASNDRPVTEKTVKVPYQQAVIADAAAEWMNYKRKCIEEGTDPIRSQVVEYICNAMRQHGRGINPYMVKELGLAVLYDDLEHRERILAKLKCEFNV